jgi:hypothetical protein
MYCQIFLVTSVRGIALAPITSANIALGFTGLMNAAFGLRFFLAFVFLALRFFAAIRPPQKGIS